MSAALDSALVTDLAGEVSGSVLGPQDAGYDSARAVHNGLIDRRPALIVRCRTACDVAAALALARRAGLEVSIRGGGHNVAGRAVTDGGLMIDLATAEGDVLHVDAACHSDLFWALRGGGGNFGVATSFTYRLHPVQTIVGGLIAHPIDAAPDLLRFYRDAVRDASDDLTVFAGLVHAADGSRAKLAALVACHSGDPIEAERDLEPFKIWGSPLVVDVGPMPYPVMNTLLDGGFPPGSLNYWLSSFTRGLPDELIEIAVDRFANAPSPMSSILLEHFHGAVTRIGATETAVPHRDEAGTFSF